MKLRKTLQEQLANGKDCKQTNTPLLAEAIIYLTQQRRQQADTNTPPLALTYQQEVLNMSGCLP